MCRNITTLRGLEPPATSEEIEAAALQYVRKVSGLSQISPAARAAVDEAVASVAAATEALLAVLPPRKQPPPTVPPLRRPEVQARLAAKAASAAAAPGAVGTKRPSAKTKTTTKANVETKAKLGS